MLKRINLKRVLLLASIIILIIIVILRYHEFNENYSLNLLIISVDTLRADHMGIYGYTKNITPKILDILKNNPLTLKQVYTRNLIT